MKLKLVCSYCKIEFDPLKEGIQIAGIEPDEDGNFELDEWACDDCACEFGYLDPEERIMQ